VDTLGDKQGGRALFERSYRAPIPVFSGRTNKRYGITEFYNPFAWVRLAPQAGELRCPATTSSAQAIAIGTEAKSDQVEEVRNGRTEFANSHSLGKCGARSAECRVGSQGRNRDLETIRPEILFSR
jgi:hypothetical protein